MSIKAIVTDLDGTLLDSTSHVSAKNQVAITKAHHKGILFGIASGRDVTSILSLLPSWNLQDVTDFIVGSGGAEVWDVQTHQTEESYPLDGPFVLELFHHFDDLHDKINFIVPKDGILYAPWDDAHIRRVSEGDQMPYKVVDYEELLTKPVKKLCVISDEDTMDKVVDMAQSFTSPHFKAAALKTSARMYEFMDPRISKTYGIEKILKEFDLALDNLVAFGDQDNDIDMLENAGIGVAVANASESAKQAADALTASNLDDGVAKYISEHLLNTK